MMMVETFESEAKRLAPGGDAARDLRGFNLNFGFSRFTRPRHSFSTLTGRSFLCADPPSLPPLRLALEADAQPQFAR